MNNYRIVKKYWRDEETQRIYEYYQVQYLGWRLSLLHFPKKYIWKPLTKRVCYGPEAAEYKEPVNFVTYEEAEKYLKNMLIPVFTDEVVYLGISHE